MKKFGFLILMLSAPFYMWCQGNGGDTLSLSVSEVVDVLKSNNLSIKASELKVDAAEEMRKAQRGLYYPSLDVSASFVQMDEALTLDLSPIRDAILPSYDLIGGQTAYLKGMTDYLAATGSMDATTYAQFNQNIDALNSGKQQAVTEINAAEWEKVIQEDQFAKVDASIMWPIYTGGKIRAANKAAEARLQVTKAESEQLVNSELTNLLNTYFGLQLAYEVKQVREEVLEGMELHLYNAKKLEEHGMIAHVEALHAEVAVVEAKRELKKADNNIELLQTALQNILATDAIIKPTSKLFISASKSTLEGYISRTQQSNPGIKQLAAKESLAKQAVVKERAAYLPNVIMFGQADLANYQYSEYAPEWVVGVGMKMNIFDGLTKVHKTQAAKIQQQQVQVYQKKVNLDLETAVTKVYQQMLQSAENYSSAETSQKFAEEYLRITKKSFTQGISTSTHVVDAQMNLAKVEIDKLLAMYHYDMYIIKLLELENANERIINYL